MRGGVIPQPGLGRDLSVRDRGGCRAVGAGVDCDDDCAAETEVVLQTGAGVWFEAVVGPAAEVPG